MAFFTLELDLLVLNTQLNLVWESSYYYIYCIQIKTEFCKSQIGNSEIEKYINLKLKNNKIIWEYQHVTIIQNQALEKSQIWWEREINAAFQTSMPPSQLAKLQISNTAVTRFSKDVQHMEVVGSTCLTTSERMSHLLPEAVDPLHRQLSVDSGVQVDWPWL